MSTWVPVAGRTVQRGCEPRAIKTPSKRARGIFLAPRYWHRAEPFQCRRHALVTPPVTPARCDRRSLFVPQIPRGFRAQRAPAADKTEEQRQDHADDGGRE